MTGDLSTTDTLAARIEASRRSLDLIGEGDWTRQDALHLMLADAATDALARLRQDSSAAGTELRDALEATREALKYGRIEVAARIVIAALAADAATPTRGRQ